MTQFLLYSCSRKTFAIALSLLLSACGPVVTKPGPMEKLHANAQDIPVPTYRIVAGDEVEVKFFFAPELNDLVQVRPDGRISLMFAQDIQAAGKTPEELSGDIKKKLKSYMKQSDLVVVMRSFANQKVFVGGEVAKPGAVQLAGNENLLQVINEAGWITPTGSADEVVLVRKGDDGKEAVYPLNLSKVISGEDVSQNINVMAGDIVLVPPSDVTAFDRWIDQHIRQALPLNSSVVITNQYTNNTL
jgi:polysaccharide export outer membrane protein